MLFYGIRSLSYRFLLLLESLQQSDSLPFTDALNQEQIEAACQKHGLSLDGEETEPDDLDDDGNAFREDITRQDIFLQYVYWKDYREGDARTWEDVPWVAYRHLMTRRCNS